MAATVPMVAEGHNNQAGLTRWDRIDPCMFIGYKNFTMQTWNSQESREHGGDQRYKRIGKPWASLTFPILYEEEFNYIMQTLFNGAEDGPLTVNVYNRDEMRWMNANVDGRLPEDRNFDIELGYFTNFVLEYRNISEIV